MIKIKIFFGLALLLPTLGFAKVEVQGHRGARSRLPENTIEGFEYALAQGVDVLEMDMAVSKDEIIVISHDPHINPTICLGYGKTPLAEPGPLIHSLTLAEIQKFDCGSLKNPKFQEQKPIPNAKIPTLESVFQMVNASKHRAAKTVRFNIETKITEENPEYTVTPEQFVTLFLKVVKKFKMESRVILQSFDYRTIRISKKLAPEIKTAALTDSPTEDWTVTIKNTKADIFSPYYKIVSPERIKAVRDLKVTVVPWTLNEKDDWKKMISMGVDGIITDDPQALIAYLIGKN